MFKQVSLFSFLIFFFYTSCLKAQDVKEKTMELSISGGLNSNFAWELEPMFTYRLSKEIGLAMGLNCSTQFRNDIYKGAVMSNGNQEWVIDTDQSNVSSVLLHPAVRYSLPSITLGKDKDYTITFCVEPGLYLTTPNDRINVKYISKNIYHEDAIKDYSNKDGKWLFWNTRLYVGISIDDFIISAGYTLSNLDVYANRRSIIIENKKLGDLLPNKAFSHSAFLSIGKRF